MRRSFSVAALVALMGSAMLLAAPAAVAQTGYPPTCNPADIPQDAGAHNIGETFNVVLSPPCVFTAGASVTITVNGVSVGVKIADRNGFVTVRVRVVSATELAIEDPITVPTRCGTNTVVGTGPSAVAGGVDVSQTVNFTVLCPGTAGTGTSGAAKAQNGQVAFTGANVAKWAAVALALVLVGAVLVTLNRRRRNADS